MVVAADIIGAWRLVTWENRDEAGAVTYPFGPDAVGYLVYTAAGIAVMELMTANRAPYAGGDILRGTPDERAAAAGTYRAYAARWELRGDDRVRLTFLTSLYPNRVGTSDELFVDRDENDRNRMTIRTAPLLSDGAMQVNRFLWERVAVQE